MAIVRQCILFDLPDGSFKGVAVDGRVSTIILRPECLPAEQVALGRYARPKGSQTTNWLREAGGIGGEPYGLAADAFPPEVLRAACVAAATV